VNSQNDFFIKVYDGIIHVLNEDIKRRSKEIDRVKSLYIDKKIEIMKIYESEMGCTPFLRNEEAIRGLVAF